MSVKTELPVWATCPTAQFMFSGTGFLSKPQQQMLYEVMERKSHKKDFLLCVQSSKKKNNFNATTNRKSDALVALHWKAGNNNGLAAGLTR